MDQDQVGAAISIKGICKRFEDKEVLRGIDLEIPNGAYATLLGPSGSGKTTLLRIIAGFGAPDKGSVSISGVDVTMRRARERELGMVFQNYALFPHLTARENIEYPLRVRKLSKTARKSLADEYLERVQLTNWANSYPHTLSGGQQQRVALARGLVCRPKVLLLDEPLGALDKHLRNDMQEFLRQLQHDVGITFIHVTHDQSEALALSTTVVVLRDGRLEQVGSPEELYLHPRTSFVAGFMGDSNLVSALVIDRSDQSLGVALSNGTECLLPNSNAKWPDSSHDVRLVLRPGDAEFGDGTSAHHVVVSGTIQKTTFMGTHYEVVLVTELGALTAHCRTNHIPGGHATAAWPLDKIAVVPA
ncbi:ABC transporter ATP-binding protein [Mesorhizobium sp. M1312]|uniref:ABC transporter ATP-binding protein n=1 Tax=unclassified Mesorhizobium TaxID=325217 RepID=UPI00333CBE71